MGCGRGGDDVGSCFGVDGELGCWFREDYILRKHALEVGGACGSMF